MPYKAQFLTHVCEPNFVYKCLYITLFCLLKAMSVYIKNKHV